MFPTKAGSCCRNRCPPTSLNLYEVSAPEGYVLSKEPVPFTVDGSEAVVTVVQYNQPQKGQITITKTGEVFASVQENEGFYQPVYEVAGSARCSIRRHC